MEKHSIQHNLSSHLQAFGRIVKLQDFGASATSASQCTVKYTAGAHASPHVEVSDLSMGTFRDLTSTMLNAVRI